MATLSKTAEIVAKQTIHPIGEFFPVDFERSNEKEFIDTREEDRKALRKTLSESKGVYSFYNSEYEIIYIGKTKSNLWNEMKSAYNREMEHYKRYLVVHPYIKYKPTSENKVRHIQSRNSYIYDAARYFSAYHIPDDTLIDLIELMMIRMIPNDVVNVRMEGNGSLINRTLDLEE